MRNLITSARAVVVVSHDLASLSMLCDKVLWLDHGRIHMTGTTKEVIAAYKQQQSADIAQLQAA
jgi:ABC-type polysaccharide/polyol phosphate transport system ATPase subunit